MDYGAITMLCKLMRSYISFRVIIVVVDLKRKQMVLIDRNKYSG